MCELWTERTKYNEIRIPKVRSTGTLVCISAATNKNSSFKFCYNVWFLCNDQQMRTVKEVKGSCWHRHLSHTKMEVNVWNSFASRSKHVIRHLLCAEYRDSIIPDMSKLSYTNALSLLELISKCTDHSLCLKANGGLSALEIPCFAWSVNVYFHIHKSLPLDLS